MTALVDVDLRKSDFTLTDDQHTVRSTFAGLFERECPIDRVRAAEPLGYDESLWQRLIDTGMITMGLPEALGGDGAGLVELALIAEQQGIRLAPVPLVPVVTAARLLARCGERSDASRRVVLALHPAFAGRPQLVPGGAVADGVVGLLDDRLVLATRDAPVDVPRNMGSEPLAWWDLADPSATRTELAHAANAAELFEEAGREWRTLTAAALVGVAQGALDLAVQYAKDREAFGVPIGAFQAVAHPLADVEIAIQGARHLVWKAAWLVDHEPTSAPVAIEMAYLYAFRTAELATRVGIHTQGGFGFTLESDMQLYFRRAKSWALVAGDPRAQLSTIADLLYGPVGAR